MVEHGRARIDDKVLPPSANRREDLKKTVDAGLIGEEFQTTNEKTETSAVVSFILKTGRRNSAHRLTGQRILYGENNTCLPIQSR